MLEIDAAGLRLHVWPSPATAIPARQRDTMMPDFWELVRDGFPAIAAVADEADLVEHYLDVTAGAYAFEGDRCRAVCTVDPIELASSRVLYLSGANIHSALRGRGIYRPLILLRLALGRRWGCEWWATRTVNPLVADSFRRFDPYPWVTDPTRDAVAAELAAVLYVRFGVLEPQPGQAFDPQTGVLGRAYPTYPYETVPWDASGEVADHFARHVDHRTGDALLLVGRLDDAIEAMASTCDDVFGRSFERLVDDLGGI